MKKERVKLSVRVADQEKALKEGKTPETANRQIGGRSNQSGTYHIPEDPEIQDEFHASKNGSVELLVENKKVKGFWTREIETEEGIDISVNDLLKKDEFGNFYNSWLGSYNDLDSLCQGMAGKTLIINEPELPVWSRYDTEGRLIPEGKSRNTGRKTHSATLED